MTTNNSNKREQERAPVYIPFKTFQTAIATLEQGIPPTLDRSVWPSFSGGLQSQTLGAFKFLGLIDNNGNAQPVLERLVKAKGDDQKAVLRGIIQDKYAEAIQLAGKNASFQQLEDYFRAYNVKPGTLYRIVQFFLHACNFTGIKWSTHWAKAKKAPRRSPKKDEVKDRGITPPALPPDEHPKANIITIKLRSGGTMALSLPLDIVSLSKEDRDFAFGMVDQLKAYESKNEKE